MKAKLYLLISLCAFHSYAQAEWESMPIKNSINIHEINFFDYANCGLVDEDSDEELTCETIDSILAEEKEKPNLVIAYCKSYLPSQGYQCTVDFEHQPLSKVLRSTGMQKVNFAVALKCSGIKDYELCTWAIWGEK